MTIDRIEATATFMINEKYWFKAHWGGTVSENEDPETETLKLKERLEDMYKKIGGTKTVSIEDALPPVRSREEIVAAHIQTINECKTLRNLEMFANMVQRENEPLLFDIYHKKKKELQ